MSRKLHIGGEVKKEGWEVLNANPANYVDYVRNANDLSIFPDNTFETIYASHIAEHFDYRDELSKALEEWYRVLAPGGELLISVPDMDMLARLFLDKNQLDLGERYLIMRMMFGGHMDQYDYHVVGLNEEFLTRFLEGVGFVNIDRVDDFGLFDDTSAIVFKGYPISLNMIAEKKA